MKELLKIIEKYQYLIQDYEKQKTRVIVSFNYDIALNDFYIELRKGRYHYERNDKIDKLYIYL